VALEGGEGLRREDGTLEGLMALHERHEYRESCAGCQIALLDSHGRRLADDDPVAVAAKRVWDAAPLAQRQACNRVWVFNSRDAEDLRLAARLADLIESALKN
jgi:hypothetical protein